MNQIQELQDLIDNIFITAKLIGHKAIKDSDSISLYKEQRPLMKIEVLDAKNSQNILIIRRNGIPPIILGENKTHQQKINKLNTILHNL